MSLHKMRPRTFPISTSLQFKTAALWHLLTLVQWCVVYGFAQEFRTVLTSRQDVAIEPFRIAVSRPAWRAYIGAVLFTATSLTLLGFAFVSYGLFYTNYIPQINIERVVHLQFG